SRRIRGAGTTFCVDSGSGITSGAFAGVSAAVAAAGFLRARLRGRAALRTFRGGFRSTMLRTELLSAITRPHVRTTLNAAVATHLQQTESSMRSAAGIMRADPSFELENF